MLSFGGLTVKKGFLPKWVFREELAIVLFRTTFNNDMVLTLVVFTEKDIENVAKNTKEKKIYNLQ